VVQILEGVCQPLRLRVEQVLLGSPSILIHIQLYQLLAFYHSTVLNLMEVQSSLLATIAETKEMAYSGFQQQVKIWTDKLRRSPLTTPPDLTCPPAILDVLKQVVQVVEALESDLTGMHLYTLARPV
jgi:conserved oligomeric Golgi complex subunit 6